MITGTTDEQGKRRDKTRRFSMLRNMSQVGTYFPVLTQFLFHNGNRIIMVSAVGNQTDV